jgi:hypothetical protein
MRTPLLILAAVIAVLLALNACGPKVNLNSPNVILVTADEMAHKTEAGTSLQAYKLQSAGNTCVLLIAGEGVSTEFLSPSDIIIGGVKTALDMKAANNTVQVFNAATGAYKAITGATVATGEVSCFGAANTVIKLPGLKEALQP